MSKLANLDNIFSDIEATDFVVPTVPTPTDKRGFIYLVVDSAYLQHIKIGRSVDMYKRIVRYNSDRPVPTVRLFMISEMFLNAIEVEGKILQHMYKNTPPTTFKKEWFDIEYKQLLIDLVNEAESHFELA